MTPENNTFLNQLAETVSHRGWRLPALVLLEAGRPFAFLGGQLLWVAQPLFSLFGTTHWVAETARLLEQPTMVEALIARLEAGEE